MDKCEWNGCSNDADVVVSRPTTEEEAQPRKNALGMEVNIRLKRYVCNTHVPEAEKLGYSIDT